MGTHHNDDRFLKVEGVDEMEIEEYMKEVRENKG